mgnify:CR=1 FL=1
MPSDNQMTDNDRIEPTLNPIDVPPLGASPEEREAAQAANDTDALNKAQADLAALQAKNAELAEQFMRAQADVQNTRRRAEDEQPDVLLERHGEEQPEEHEEPEETGHTPILGPSDDRCRESARPRPGARSRHRGS